MLLLLLLLLQHVLLLEVELELRRPRGGSSWSRAARAAVPWGGRLIRWILLRRRIMPPRGAALMLGWRLFIAAENWRCSGGWHSHGQCRRSGAHSHGGTCRDDASSKQRRKKRKRSHLARQRRKGRSSDTRRRRRRSGIDSDSGGSSQSRRRDRRRSQAWSMLASPSSSDGSLHLLLLQLLLLLLQMKQLQLLLLLPLLQMLMHVLMMLMLLLGIRRSMSLSLRLRLSLLLLLLLRSVEGLAHDDDDDGAGCGDGCDTRRGEQSSKLAPKPWLARGERSSATHTQNSQRTSVSARRDIHCALRLSPVVVVPPSLSLSCAVSVVTSGASCRCVWRRRRPHSPRDCRTVQAGRRCPSSPQLPLAHSPFGEEEARRNMVPPTTSSAAAPTPRQVQEDADERASGRVHTKWPASRLNDAGLRVASTWRTEEGERGGFCWLAWSLLPLSLFLVEMGASRRCSRGGRCGGGGGSGGGGDCSAAAATLLCFAAARRTLRPRPRTVRFSHAATSNRSHTKVRWKGRH